MVPPILKINSETLPFGALPCFDFPPEWSFPFFSTSDQGKKIIRVEPRRRLTIELFEISKDDKREISNNILCLLESLCLTAGHAGRADIIVQNDMVVANPESKSLVTHVLTLGVFFTMDWDPDCETYGYNGMGCKIPGAIHRIGNYAPEEFQNIASVMNLLEG